MRNRRSKQTQQIKNNKRGFASSQNSSFLINPLSVCSRTVTLYLNQNGYSLHTFSCFDSLPAFRDTSSVTVNEAAAKP